LPIRSYTLVPQFVSQEWRRTALVVRLFVARSDGALSSLEMGSSACGVEGFSLPRAFVRRSQRSGFSFFFLFSVLGFWFFSCRSPTSQIRPQKSPPSHPPLARSPANSSAAQFAVARVLRDIKRPWRPFSSYSLLLGFRLCLSLSRGFAVFRLLNPYFSRLGRGLQALS